jgi:hypothetical protein
MVTVVDAVDSGAATILFQRIDGTTAVFVGAAVGGFALALDKVRVKVLWAVKGSFGEEEEDEGEKSASTDGVKNAPPKRAMFDIAMRTPRSCTKYMSPTLALTRASNGARPTPWIILAHSKLV